MATYNKRGFKSPKPKEVEDIDISLNSVRDAYRAQLSGNFSRARRGV